MHIIKRTFYLCRLSDMVPLFGSNTVGIRLIFNYVLDYVYNWFSHLLNSWNQDILELNNLALYWNVTHQKRAPLQNWFGFVDGTVLQISRPKINQKIVYNCIVIRNGKIVWKHGPYCWYFPLNLKYLGDRTDNTSKQRKLVAFVRNCSVKMTLRLF